MCAPRGWWPLSELLFRDLLWRFRNTGFIYRFWDSSPASSHRHISGRLVKPHHSAKY